MLLSKMARKVAFFVRVVRPKVAASLVNACGIDAAALTAVDLAASGGKVFGLFKQAGLTPLASAAKFGHAQVIDLLITRLTDGRPGSGRPGSLATEPGGAEPGHQSFNKSRDPIAKLSGEKTNFQMF